MKCPSRKNKFSTIESVKSAVASLRTQPEFKDANIYYYECPDCGKYHFTRSKTSKRKLIL